MKFIGFNFNKILIERINKKSIGEKISTKLDISSIEKIPNTLNSDEAILNVEFSYIIDYNPEVARIELRGNVLFNDSNDNINTMITKWENKEMDADFKVNLFNIILRKSNIRALQLEDDLNLPPHMKLFSIKKEQLDKKE